MVEVDIGALLEAMMRGLCAGVAEVIMNIGIAVSCQLWGNLNMIGSITHSVSRETSPCC